MAALPRASLSTLHTQWQPYDTSGNIIFSDSRRVLLKLETASGTLSHFAGAFPTSTIGDNQAATSTPVFGVVGVATDKSGNIYILRQSDSFFGGNLQSSIILSSIFRRVDRSGNIKTVIGNGLGGHGGEGIQATATSLSSPSSLAFDDSGSIMYIAETALNRVRKVENGIITTLAGNGSSLSAGDGGPATSAALKNPQGVAVDSNGNVYISESNVIRKVDTSGVISTIAGSSTSGFYGDGVPASSALLRTPTSLTVDASGMLHISDTNNHSIRAINLNSGIISTVAGNGSSSTRVFGGPAVNSGLTSIFGTTVDSAGNLSIAFSYDAFVAKVNVSGFITEYAGTGNPGFGGDGGPASSAVLFSPRDVPDAYGDLYIAVWRPILWRP